jgi:4-methyl-5(b-hydroxyethyl)-thiazole monophosphate biosynthesis
MKGCILLAPGFETTEAVATIDYLRRSGLELTIVGMESKLVCSSNQMMIQTDSLFDATDFSSYDFLVLPGGAAVKNYHLTSEKTKKVVTMFYEQHKVIAAICAAPMILGKLGMLKNKHFTCFPGCEEDHFGGFYEEHKNACCDGTIITGKAMGTTLDFAYEIVKKLLGTAQSDFVKKQIYFDK